MNQTDYRSAPVREPLRLHSPSAGCLGVVLIIALFVPLWLVPVAMAWEYLVRGIEPGPAAWVALAVTLVIDVALVRFMASGHHTVIDSEGVRHERYTSLLGFRSKTKTQWLFRWNEVRSARVLRKLLVRKSGATQVQPSLEVTFVSGETRRFPKEVPDFDAFQREIAHYLGERLETVDDFGALGATVKRMVADEVQRVREQDAGPQR